MFPKIPNWDEFVIRVALICQLIIEAVNDTKPNRYLISVDEKTGIQALSRIEKIAPASVGGHIRKEFEYTRNGTTTLIAGLNVGKGNICNYLLNETRKEEDFFNFIKATASPLLAEREDIEVVFLADQLNTHLSESLVIWIAFICGVTESLGKKGFYGILKNQQTRRQFLENPKHKVRFVFTPKHCSWLNPIENWFAKLQKHVITNGNFSSVEVLKTKIKNYIFFYNTFLVKPIKWKFRGFYKAKIMDN